MSYKIATTCRACAGTDLKPVFDLGVQPLANDHVKPDSPRQGFYPLAVNLCGQCGLAQLSVVVDPKVLYSHYTYTTSTSEIMRRHFSRLTQDIQSEGVDQTVVEIGSNDGLLLASLQASGWQVVGIEPAANLAEISGRRGVATVVGFFGDARAENARAVLGKRPAVILARHCFAHMDDWREFMQGIEVLASDETLVCIEVPYVKDLLERVEFDSVYHEHLSYVSLKPIVHLLKATPFHIHRIIRYGIHGGALLLMLRHNDSGITPHLSADEYLAEENVTAEDWERFAKAAEVKVESLQACVRRLRVDGKIVSAFGASAKATVLINACRFHKYEIAFVTDNSPFKPGCLIPGTDIPIIEESQMLSEHPDVVLCTAWNYRVEILEKMSKYRSRGGRFLFPKDAGWETI